MFIEPEVFKNIINFKKNKRFPSSVSEFLQTLLAVDWSTQTPKESFFVFHEPFLFNKVKNISTWNDVNKDQQVQHKMFLRKE